MSARAGDEWKGEPERLYFTFSGKMMDDKGEEWMESKIRRRVGDQQLRPELVPYAVAWYLEKPTRVIYWAPSDMWKEGEGSGYWCFHEPWFVSSWPRCLQAARAALDAELALRDAERFTTLDEWLHADMTGALESAGARGGRTKLPEPLRDRMSEAACTRRRHWPRRCTKCDTEFRPEKRNVKRCHDCRARVRT